jgi:hypothetical protein
MVHDVVRIDPAGRIGLSRRWQQLQSAVRAPGVDELRVGARVRDSGRAFASSLGPLQALIATRVQCKKSEQTPRTCNTSLAFDHTRNTRMHAVNR